MLEGAVDCHVHASAHLNARSVTVFEAVRLAAGVGMRAIGLMDNFASTAGVAALANRELGHLGVEVFGGLIMEPQAGGVSARAVAAALGTGYPGHSSRWADGARFISLPTHATRHVALAEGRIGLYLESCLALPESGPLPDPLPEILDLVARHDAVLNTGHLSEGETVHLVEEAGRRGVERILVPASLFRPEAVRAIRAAGATAEFSFFFVSHATQIGLTHVDAEAHRIPATTLPAMAEAIAACGGTGIVISSDCGVGVLPVPTEGLRAFLAALAAAGVAEPTLAQAVKETPAHLFRLG